MSNKSYLSLHGFLRNEESWYDPHELLKERDLLTQHETAARNIPDTKYDFIGRYHGEYYVIDPNDGYAKPLRELR